MLNATTWTKPICSFEFSVISVYCNVNQKNEFKAKNAITNLYLLAITLAKGVNMSANVLYILLAAYLPLGLRFNSFHYPI